MQLHRITDVKPLAGGHLNLGYRDGDRIAVIEVNLSPMLARGGVLEPLRDRKLFDTVAVAPDGRTIFWRIDDDIVDLCADALWFIAHPEDVPARSAG